MKRNKGNVVRVEGKRFLNTLVVQPPLNAVSEKRYTGLARKNYNITLNISLPLLIPTKACFMLLGYMFLRVSKSLA